MTPHEDKQYKSVPLFLEVFFPLRDGFPLQKQTKTAGFFRVVSASKDRTAHLRTRVRIKRKVPPLLNRILTPRMIDWSPPA